MVDTINGYPKLADLFANLDGKGKTYRLWWDQKSYLDASLPTIRQAIKTRLDTIRAMQLRLNLERVKLLETLKEM